VPSTPRVPDRGECPAGQAFRWREDVRAAGRRGAGAPPAEARLWRDDALVIAAALLPLALFVARERLIAGTPGLPLDDSWIHLQFARNLAEGAGFSFNPGHPVAGSTAPLWTLLLGASAVVFSASLWTAKALGIVITVGAGLLTRRAVLAWGAPADAALFAAAALMWMGPVVWGSLSGMEVSLAALLVAAALLAHGRDRALATAVCAALAVLARPESLLLVPLFAVARPVTIRRIATFTVATAAIVAPAVLFSLSTVGTLYPATAAAKIEGGLVGWLGGVREPASLTFIARPGMFFAEWIRWLTATHWLLALALAAGLIRVWRVAGRALGVIALGLLAHPLGMALLAPYRGPAFQEGRYSIQLLPLAVLTVAVAFGGRCDAQPIAGRRARLVVVLAWLGIAAATLVPAATRYGWAVQNINAMQVHVGRWVDENVPKTARVAVNDIGAIAFFSRREVIDLMGLVTPEIIPYRRQGESGVIQYLKEACPQYVIIFPAWFPRLAASADTLEPVHRVRLERNEVAGAAEMVVYRLTRCAV
jgi:arabinofuranosyltransferase